MRYLQSLVAASLPGAEAEVRRPGVEGQAMRQCAVQPTRCGVLATRVFHQTIKSFRYSQFPAFAFGTHRASPIAGPRSGVAVDPFQRRAGRML